ncbi:MAG: DUF4296 domain-containing protein [Chitinophagaceae bacterium]|nr:DUF4296 domain-containing protein [Chitinophagaceae bacterium]
MKLIVRILVVMSFCACTNKPKQLPFDTVKVVLWEMTNSEELMKLYVKKDSTYSIKSNRPIFYQKIFSLHQITQKDFDFSYKYYQEHPNEMKILLDSISNYGIKKREKAISSL